MQKNKKVVFWGIGNICNNCLSERPDIIPEFYIDSHSKLTIYNGKKVYKPNEVKNWNELYIVITMLNFGEVKLFLEANGLKQKEDFSVYKDFFKKTDITLKDSIIEVRKYREEKKKIKTTTVFFVPVFVGRQSVQLEGFFSRYVNYWKEKKECIIFTNKGIVNDCSADNRMGCKVFWDVPVCQEQMGICLQQQNKLCENIFKMKEDQLNEIISRKVIDDLPNALSNAKELYIYYSELLSILHADEVLIWGNWSVSTCIIKMIAEDFKIRYRFLEHGWLPGTIQSDPSGIASQSEYAVEYRKLSAIEVTKNNIEETKKIVNNIVRLKKDTSIFTDVLADAIQLKKICKDRKTVFLIGMDEKGMKMNPENCFWNNYISSNYKSMRCVLEELIPICKCKSLNLIFKPHPGNHFEDLAENDDLIYVENADIHSLIDISDVVVSMPSTAEYTVLMRGKPLIQVGKTTLNNAGCTYVVNEWLSLETAICRALHEKLTDVHKERFYVLLTKLLKNYLWDDLSERDIRYGQLVEQDFFT